MIWSLRLTEWMNESANQERCLSHFFSSSVFVFLYVQRGRGDVDSEAKPSERSWADSIKCWRPMHPPSKKGREEEREGTETLSKLWRRRKEGECMRKGTGGRTDGQRERRAEPTRSNAGNICTNQGRKGRVREHGWWKDFSGRQRNKRRRKEEKGGHSKWKETVGEKAGKDVEASMNDSEGSKKLKEAERWPHSKRQGRSNIEKLCSRFLSWPQSGTNAKAHLYSVFSFRVFCIPSVTECFLSRRW